jgi:hypothetical protein
MGGHMGETITEPASEIAYDLRKVIVEDCDSREFDQPEKYGVPETSHVHFQAKMRLYREALVLFVLLSKSNEDNKYEPVLRNYESLIMRANDGMTKLEALKGAMRNLKDLLNPTALQERGLSWSRSWFAGIGYDQTNPINLFLFSTHWAETYLAVRESVDNLALMTRLRRRASFAQMPGAGAVARQDGVP